MVPAVLSPLPPISPVSHPFHLLHPGIIVNPRLLPVRPPRTTRRSTLPFRLRKRRRPARRHDKRGFNCPTLPLVPARRARVLYCRQRTLDVPCALVIGGQVRPVV